ncbi:MAG: hypothetical protein RJQ09_00745 [Cyclobacteriaceae bacterium]
MKNTITQHQVKPITKRYFKNRQVAVAYFEYFTGYSYERTKNEAGIPWNIWPVVKGNKRYFIGTVKEWVESDVISSKN